MTLKELNYLDLKELNQTFKLERNIEIIKHSHFIPALKNVPVSHA